MVLHPCFLHIQSAIGCPHKSHLRVLILCMVCMLWSYINCSLDLGQMQWFLNKVSGKINDPLNKVFLIIYLVTNR